ncbi:MAG: VOC family protein, partial [Aestuariivirga sp.]
MSTMQNPFIWHDLISADVAAAKKFYKSVIGWNFEPQTPEYTVAMVGDAGVGGILAMPQELKGMPPFWSGYIYTPDVDAACAKVKKLGGKVHREPWDASGIVRVAVVGDPTGANFNIMNPISPQQRNMAPEGAVGTVGWNELHAGDLNAAWDFYSEMFGWTKGGVHDMGPMGIYQLFQIDGKDVGGMMKKMD